MQQFVEENHLRWDSLGEFLALAASLEHLGNVTGNKKAFVLAQTLDDATGVFLDEDRSPQRDVGQLDNRGGHFYIALYWAEALAKQTDDAALQKQFNPIAKALRSSEQKIVDELNAAQGVKVDIGGYYKADPALCSKAMKPSATLNAILAGV